MNKYRLYLNRGDSEGREEEFDVETDDIELDRSVIFQAAIEAIEVRYELIEEDEDV